MEDRIILEKYNHKKLGWLHDALKFIGLVVALFIIFRFVIGVSVVDGNSMNPTLTNGEVVIYLRPARNFKTGDIVCVWVPSGHYYVKRIMAVGGDVVDIRGGSLYVNDEEITDYATGTTISEQGAVIYPYTVSEGDYFVMGDNREVSIDSRTFGEVSSLQIRGRIVASFGGEK